jgi:DUF1680 family protein
MDAIKILQEDAKAIYIGNLNTVDTDLKLPLKGKNGADISWVSSHPYVVNEVGKVIRPHAGTGNRNLQLTARLSYEGEILEQVFNVTVLARELNWKVVKLLPTEISIGLEQINKVKLPCVVIAEKDTGGFAAISVKWGVVPTINSTGKYYVKGEPPLEKQPEIVPEAIIHVFETQSEYSPHKQMLEPFPLNQVKIDGGIFSKNKKRMLEFLLNVIDDSMLYNFRDAAGMDTKDAPPLSGWDAPECLLKGHTSGHYLSALAYACCSGENEEIYKRKLRYMVKSLAECQNSMAESGNFKEGFLSGYWEDQFDLLEQFVTYPSIWAPYYTLHKIMAGLLDAYEFAGENTALQIAEKLGLWVFNRLEAAGAETRRKMWAMYIAGEYGGMNEVMARLYKISPNPEYLQAARFFDNDLLFYPMEKNINTLPGMHGNQHIPQMIGAMEMFAQTSEKKYFDSALHFWQIVSANHSYSIGGVGEGEMFREPNHIASNLTEKTAESCASYNMLKLTSHLFNYTADSAMADYFERTLYNHIAASHDQSGPTSGSTYFMPLLPGGKKGYDKISNTCCHGTGLENHLKYQEMIYLRCDDALYVNLFIPSRLHWVEKGIKIILRDGYLENESAEIVVEGSAYFKLKLRIPGWLKEKPKLFLNGAETEYTEKKGYAILEREFTDGDYIRWVTPFTFCFEPTPDDDSIGSILYGPLVMVAESDKKEFLQIGSLTPQKTDEPLTFTCGGYKLRPNYMAWDYSYHAYVKR